MAQAAALARIEELAKAGGEDRRREMTTNEGTGTPAAAEAGRELKAATRAMWALGDYHKFATELVWELGPVLVEACGISASQRVLDVATGSGNVAIRAAEAGAQVVASDLTPENFEAGRREARARGAGARLGRGRRRGAALRRRRIRCRHLLVRRDVRPESSGGGRRARTCLPARRHDRNDQLHAQGLAADFFGVLAPYMPPPSPGALPPLMWGSEEHVRELFGDRVESLEMTRREYVESAASPRAYREFFKVTFGPGGGHLRKPRRSTRTGGGA